MIQTRNIIHCKQWTETLLVHKKKISTNQEIWRWPILDCSDSLTFFLIPNFKSFTVAEFITGTSIKPSKIILKNNARHLFELPHWTEEQRIENLPKKVPSILRTEMRIALPSSKLIRVSTSEREGFLGTSERIGSSRSAARVELSLALFTLLVS